MIFLNKGLQCRIFKEKLFRNGGVRIIVVVVVIIIIIIIIRLQVIPVLIQ